MATVKAGGQMQKPGEKNKDAASDIVLISAPEESNFMKE